MHWKFHFFGSEGRNGTQQSWLDDITSHLTSPVRGLSYDEEAIGYKLVEQTQVLTDWRSKRSTVHVTVASATIKSILHVGWKLMDERAIWTLPELRVALFLDVFYFLQHEEVINSYYGVWKVTSITSNVQKYFQCCCMVQSRRCVSVHLVGTTGTEIIQLSPRVHSTCSTSFYCWRIFSTTWMQIYFPDVTPKGNYYSSSFYKIVY